MRERSRPVSIPQALTTEAYYGLAGDLIKLIEPHTEAHPAALLLQLLVAAGNVIGPGPHFVAEADRHRLNLFGILVGETSKGRKGSSWSQIRRLFDQVDPEWGQDRVTSGLSSGEGLIWHVRDATALAGDPKAGADPGVADKRLFVIESEFASVLRLIGREGNTLSAVIRNAWDLGDLRTLTKSNPTRATGAHISMIGHITRAELLRYLATTDAVNGFANRLIFIWVSRSKVLPEGGSLRDCDLAEPVRRLEHAVMQARCVDELRRDDEARELWGNVYPELSEGKPGLLGAVIARAEAQVMRLACIYALLDEASVIRAEHLTAAIALWDYSEESARYIFGERLGDPLADDILSILRAEPEGLTRDQLRDQFSRHKGAADLDRALQSLVELGLAGMNSVETAGRPAQLWRAVSAESALRSTSPLSPIDTTGLSPLSRFPRFSRTGER